MTLRAKAENIWYHYKYHILAGIFLFGTLIVCLHSCVTKPEFDIHVYYVTGSSPMYNEQLAWIESAVASQCEDVNGDGKVTVAVTGLRVGENSDATERAQYLNAIQAGEVMLLFGDEGGINYLHKNGYLQSLTEFSDQLDGEGYAWKVTGSVFSSLTEGYDVFSEPLYVSLRIFDNSWSSIRPSAKENYKTACNTLRSMIHASAEE